MKIIAEIPVKRYLIGFLENEFGTECKLSAHNPLSRVLFGYLHVREKGRLPKITDDYIYYRVHIPVRYFVKYRVSSISEEGMWQLGDWFEDFFNRIMKEYIISRLELKNQGEIMSILINNQKKSLIQIEQSIKDFLKKNHVSEEFLPVETALKRFYRAKKGASILN